MGPARQEGRERLEAVLKETACGIGRVLREGSRPFRARRRGVPGCNVPRHRDPEPGARRRLHSSQRRGGTRVHRQPPRETRGQGGGCRKDSASTEIRRLRGGIRLHSRSRALGKGRVLQEGVETTLEVIRHVHPDGTVGAEPDLDPIRNRQQLRFKVLVSRGTRGFSSCPRSERAQDANASLSCASAPRSIRSGRRPRFRSYVAFANSSRSAACICR